MSRGRELDDTTASTIRGALDRSSRLAAHVDVELLLGWRVTQLCQLLYFDKLGAAKSEILAVLTAFVNGAPLSESASNARDVLRRQRVGEPSETRGSSIVPRLAKAHEADALGALQEIVRRSVDIVEEAQRRRREIPRRVSQRGSSLLSLGIAHRADLALAAVEDSQRSTHDRTLAASALIYLVEREDLIPDDLGSIGMLDDDYVLRSVTAQLYPADPTHCLHWAERAAGVLHDVPLLENLHLSRNGAPEPVTWFDRANAYLAYAQIIDRIVDPLVIVVPTTEIQPLYTLITLMALSLLDDLTDPSSTTHAIRQGQVVCIDGLHHGRYMGPSSMGAHLIGLEFRDGKRHVDDTWLMRMKPADAWQGKLSKATCLRKGTEPIQQVFGWEQRLGMSSFASSVVFVTRREHARELLVSGAQTPFFRRAA